MLTGGDADDQVFGESRQRPDDLESRRRHRPERGRRRQSTPSRSTAAAGPSSSPPPPTAPASASTGSTRPLSAIDIGTSENLVLNANGGNDTFSATGNLAALIKITVDGGAGNDTVLGSNGIDLLIGGEGNDFIDGQQGNDVAFMGAGDDVFQWDPGDGSDIVEGQDGTDTMLFNGMRGNEIFAGVGQRRARCCSPATSATSSWTSTTSRPSTSTPWAAPTRRRSTT